MIGEFACPIDHPQFADTGPIENHLLVVPFLPVEISFSRARSVVADRTRALFYNRGTRYRRESLNRHGDRALWFAFDDELLRECCGKPGRQPFDTPAAALPMALYLGVRSIYLRLRNGSPDPLEVEESALRLLEDLVRMPASEADAANPRQRRILATADAYLAKRYSDTVCLADMANVAACSPFHLSRLFRRLRGVGIHQQLMQLRLRDAIDRMQENRDSLTDIALNLGFSSPSHFSSSFRNGLGVSPSHFRAHGSPIRAIS